MGIRHAEYTRAANDWYIEPAWVADALFRQLTFAGSVHDPCAGAGTIVDAATRCGLKATGADVVDRTGADFLL
jgi:hypothetical protein